MKLALLGIVLLGLVGCSHNDPHAFIAPSNAAIVGDLGIAKASAVKASHGDRKAAQQVVDERSKAQADRGADAK